MVYEPLSSLLLKIENTFLGKMPLKTTSFVRTCLQIKKNILNLIFIPHHVLTFDLIVGDTLAGQTRGFGLVMKESGLF